MAKIIIYETREYLIEADDMFDAQDAFDNKMNLRDKNAYLMDSKITHMEYEN